MGEYKLEIAYGLSMSHFKPYSSNWQFLSRKINPEVQLQTFSDK
jgi:hypothetical protein